MKRRLAQVWGACFALAFGTSAAIVFMVDSALVPEQQAALREVLSASAGVIVVAAFIVFATHRPARLLADARLTAYPRAA